jgi:predicted Fe-Mo cluster-binding NifX family protein
MTYAIAMSEKKLAHHFSKADTFTFYNDQNKAVAVYKNPALTVSGCSGKASIIHLLKDRQCHTVIVRKVGQKTLGKLLNAGVKVVQGNTRHTIEELLENARLGKNQLTDASQGVEKKKSSCCGHH